MSDRFEDALSAFRAEQDRARGDAPTGRRRLLAAARRRDARRRAFTTVALAAALLASNSMTWAWSTGRLDGVLDRIGGEAEPAPARLASSAPSPPAPSLEPSTAPVAAPAREPESTAIASMRSSAPLERADAAASRAAAQPVLPADRGDPESRARRRSPAPPPRGRNEPGAQTEGSAEERPAVAEPSATSQADGLSAALRELEVAPPSPDLDRRAFAEAHRLHFGGAPPDQALGAWDRYLARFPQGRFAPEARFNRAVALLRLQRDEDARAALRPFAAGAYDGFRAREARALLDALDAGALRR